MTVIVSVAIRVTVVELLKEALRADSSVRGLALPRRRLHVRTVAALVAEFSCSRLQG